jgi:type II secretory pathway pseudopilin PulG
MAQRLTSADWIRRGIARWKSLARSERGFSLVESMVAGAILITAVVGILPALVLGFQTTEQQGAIATRATEYAQDKIESLISLDFNDGATDTTVFPPNATGGSGLGGVMAVNATVGAIPPAAAAASYVDYLDASGNLLTGSTGAYYTRAWSISTDSTATLKTITVVVKSTQAAGVKGLAPSTTLVSIKSSGL